MGGIRARGSITSRIAERLRREIDRTLKKFSGEVTLQLDKIEYLDSAAAALIFGIEKNCERRDCTFIQGRTNDYVDEMLSLFDFDKIPSRKGEGDLLVTTSTKFPNYNFKENETIELKSSYLSSDGSWNFIQLRPYEKFDYYLFLLIDPLNGCDYEYILLNKEDVNDSNFKLNSIHGTKESNKENKNIEYKLNVPKGSDVYEKLISLNLI